MPLLLWAIALARAALPYTARLRRRQ